MNLQKLETVFLEDYDANTENSFALAAYRRSYALALMQLDKPESICLSAFIEAEELANMAISLGVPQAQLQAAAYQLRRCLAQPEDE